MRELYWLMVAVAVAVVVLIWQVLYYKGDEIEVRDEQSD
jgi:hypothetical protein